MGELAGGFEPLDVSPSGRSTTVKAHLRPASADDVEACAVLSAQVSDIQHADWMQILGRDVDMTDRLLAVAVRDQLIVGYGRAGQFDPPEDARQRGARRVLPHGPGRRPSTQTAGVGRGADDLPPGLARGPYDPGLVFRRRRQPRVDRTSRIGRVWVRHEGLLVPRVHR